MNPQAATALQPTKGPVSVRKSATGDVFEQIQQTYDWIARRASEIFDNNGRWFGHELDDWFRAESELLHPLHLELAGADDNVTVRAEVPGFSAKEININVEPRRLTISGKHQTQEESKRGKMIYSERCANEILRVLELPAEVDSSNVSAILRDGVLNIEMPKAAHTTAARIEPKAA
jgi:HSP20 family protein